MLLLLLLLLLLLVVAVAVMLLLHLLLLPLKYLSCVYCQVSNAQRVSGSACARSQPGAPTCVVSSFR